MKRIAATLIGTALASGLALTAQPDSPEKLAARYFAATNEAGLAASWRDWHPDATQSITVKYGGTQPDYHITYAMRDWDQLPDWKSDPRDGRSLARIYRACSKRSGDHTQGGRHPHLDHGCNASGLPMGRLQRADGCH